MVDSMDIRKSLNINIGTVMKNLEKSIFLYLILFLIDIKLKKCVTSLFLKIFF